MNVEKFLLIALVVTIVMVTFYVIFLRERASGDADGASGDADKESDDADADADEASGDDDEEPSVDAADNVSPDDLYTILSGQTRVFWNEVPILGLPPYMNPTTTKPFKMRDIKRITFKGITEAPININIRVPYEKLKIHDVLGGDLSPRATTKPSLANLVIDSNFEKYYTLVNVNH